LSGIAIPVTWLRELKAPREFARPLQQVDLVEAALPTDGERGPAPQVDGRAVADRGVDVRSEQRGRRVGVKRFWATR